MTKTKLLPCLALAAAFSLASSTVSAAQITYEGDISSGATFVGGLQGGNSSDLVNNGGYDVNNIEGRQYWSFSANIGDTVSIVARRLDGDLDVDFILYVGTTTADELDFQGIPFSFGGLKRIRSRHDNIDAYVDGPFGDAQLLDYTLPGFFSSDTGIDGTGVQNYTVVVLSAANGAACLDGNECSYALALDSQIGALPVAAVPVPAAAWLFGSGLLGLVGVARRKG